jgi:hypothetical protein
MSCQPTIPFIELPPAFSTCTWPGLTWTIVETEATEFDEDLVSVAFQFQSESGTPVLTLRSSVAGEITINSTAPRAWSATVDQRILGLPPGNYAWALETIDAIGVQQPRLTGTITVKPDPIA